MTDHAMLLDALSAAVGPQAILIGSCTDSYVTDWRGLSRGKALCVLRPESVEAVSAAIRICASRRVAVVPQGGNTSMVNGSTPDDSGSQVVLSLVRMNKVRSVDTLDMTMALEAGVVVRDAQVAALEAGCVFPLSFSAEGSATIGGALASNAGGNNTVRYGSTRDLTLGLEVVLPDGRIWNGLRALRKDNAGYALKHLFVGSEGTLGVITAAVIKIYPAPRSEELAFCSVPDEQSALSLFRRFQDADDTSVRSFEYMSGFGIDLVLSHIPATVLPLRMRSDHYVLIDLASRKANAGLRALAEDILGEAIVTGEVIDAVIAESVAQCRAIWRLREEHSEAQKREGKSIKNDVSVPVSQVPEFVRQVIAACTRIMPGIRPAPFGHIGDGNIHLNFVQPREMSGREFLSHSDQLTHAVNEVVHNFGGSFAAEHGIGRTKLEMLPYWRDETELHTMRSIKRAIDPASIMNPGRVLLPE